MKSITFNFTDMKEALPEISGDYICLMKSGGAITLAYSSKNRIFNAYDHNTKVGAMVYSLNEDVAMWAPIGEEVEKAGEVEEHE